MKRARTLESPLTDTERGGTRAACHLWREWRYLEFVRVELLGPNGNIPSSLGVRGTPGGYDHPLVPTPDLRRIKVGKSRRWGWKGGLTGTL